MRWAGTPKTLRDLAGGQLALLEELAVVGGEADRGELGVVIDDRDRWLFWTPP